jgi:rhodanese-related sulfurtransferase
VGVAAEAERNVLEWRFDPASSARLPVATDHDIQVIVFWSEDDTSSLAAIALQDLGLCRATDMIGGFQAWRALGLPIVPPSKAF